MAAARGAAFGALAKRGGFGGCRRRRKRTCSGMNALQHIDEVQAFLLRKIAEKLQARFSGESPNLIENGARFVFNLQAAGASIVRIRAPLDPTFGFHVIEYANHAHGIDFGELSQTHLTYAFVSG